MKVLVINGSPKNNNSNTLKLTRSFLDGAGWKDAEIINVAKTGIGSCRGCFACWNKTPGRCVINDGMSEILAKIITADVVIWSFPLFYYSVPGDLKNLIDRQLPLLLPFMDTKSVSGKHPSRYGLSYQKNILISTCGFWTSNGNYNSVIPMFDYLYGKDNYSKILCGQGELFRIPELKNRTDAYLEIIRRAGDEYTTGGICSETQSALSEPLFPREIFEKMTNDSWGISGSDATENFLITV